MQSTLFDTALQQALSPFRGKRLLIAFSGGKDSLALLHAVARLSGELDITVGACHVHHGIRQSAEADAEACRRFCTEAGIPFFLERVDAPKRAKALGESMEQAARAVRYAALEKVRQQHSFDLICTAHTRDDQVESLFVDIATGASLFTLGGVRSGAGAVIRPMLNIATADVEAYVLKHALSPVFDETNDDVRYVRNRVRRDIIPAMRECGMADSAVLRMQSDSLRLDSYFSQKVQHCLLLDTPDMAVFDKDAVLLLCPLEREYLFGREASRRIRFSRSQLDAMLQLCGAEHASRISVAGGFRFEVSYHTFRLFHERFVAPFVYDGVAGGSLHIPERNCSVALPEGGVYTVRSRRDGDRYGSKKLKDRFIDAKKDLFCRDSAVIVEKNGAIIFAEGIDTGNEIAVIPDERGAEWRM